jgi:hypothetical protein
MIQYVVINDKARIIFEKEHQMPYGYAQGWFFNSLMEAMSEYADIPREEREEYVIEMVEGGNSKVIYPENMKDGFAEVGK